MLAATPTAYGPNLLSRLLAACTLQQVDECAKSAWILNGEGLVGDNEMEYLAPIIEHQRRSICASGWIRRAPSSERAGHRRPAVPKQKRAAAWLRRRSLAKDCIIPTCFARAFTVSKLAVLAVIARAVLDHGVSHLSLPEIAARAGVGCTTARYAIREAGRLGLISVIENRINKSWNRPNAIRIVCGRWLRWLKGHRRLCAAQKTDRGSFAGRFDTPLRNMSPMIEINRFKVHCFLKAAVTAHADPPYDLVWKGSEG